MPNSIPSPGRRIAIAAVMACLLVVIGARAPGAGSDLAARIGVVYRGEGGVPYLEIHAQSLAAGTPVNVVLFADQEPRKLVHAGVTGAPQIDLPITASHVFGRTDMPVRYALRIDGGEPFAAGDIGIGVIGAPSRCRIDDGRVRCDLEGDGTPGYFRFCTSNEGVHLTAWSGTPPEGVRRWHAYYFLAYDVEPSCSVREISE